MPAIVNFNGLYGDRSPTVLPDFVHCEPLEVRSRHYNWVIGSHVHTHLFQVFCIEMGQGQLVLGARQIEFAGPCLLLIPENTLHGFTFAAEAGGMVISLSAAYVEQLFGPASLIRSELDNLHILLEANAPELFADALRLIRQLRAELFGSLPERTTMLQALFSALFTTLYRLACQQNAHGLTQDNRSLLLFRTFLKRIKDARHPQKTITAYAAELRISAVHLNRICRAVAQKSAVQVVQSHFMAEAQHYLMHTSFSISEVAYALNYEDPAYFSRVFRQYTGLAPRQFRQAQEEAGRYSATL